MIRQARRVLRRAAATGMLVALALVAAATTVSAHSYFIDSDPADGSMLERAPDHVVLVFSSPVDTKFSEIQLIEVGGAKYAPTKVISYPDYKQAIDVVLPKIPNGSYRLTFTVVDALDFHKTTGTIVFGVGMPPPKSAPIPQAAPAQPKEVALRWIALAGLAGLLGGLALAIAVIGRLPDPAEVRTRLQRAMLNLALIGTAGILVGETGLLLLQASSLGPVLPSTFRLLSGSEFGTRWWVATLIALGLLPLLVNLRGSFGRGTGWFVQLRILLLCIGLTVALAFSGHVAGASGTSIGGVTLLTLHIGSMGLWAGGVCALALSLALLRRISGGIDRASLVALVVGFGKIAVFAFAVLGISGLLLSGLQVASITALLSTPYGLFLICKVVLVGLVALIGLRHALLTWRGLRAGTSLRIPKRLPLTVTLEGVGALAVVLLASVLGASAPAQGPQFDPPSNSLHITQVTRDQNELLVTLSIKPNRPGPNLVSVVVANKSWPAAQAQTVIMQLAQPGVSQTLPTTASVRPAGNSFTQAITPMAFDAGMTRLAAGDLRFTVTVQRIGWADTVVVIPWKVPGAPVPQAPVVVSDHRIAPIATMLAILAAIAALVVIAAGRIRRGGVPASGGLLAFAREPRRHSHQLSSRPNAQLRIRAGEVRLNGPSPDAQLPADLARGKTLSGEPSHLELSSRQ